MIKMIVYADILFFINFFMNYLIISVSGAICPEPLKNRRKLLASALGGIYGVCVFIPDLTFMYSVLSVFLFSLALAAIVFCPCSIKDYFRFLAVYYISSFLLAGGIYMVLPYFGGGIVKNNVIYYKNIGVVFSGTLVSIIIIKWIKHMKIHSKRKGYVVKIKYGESSATLKGMLDTGNMLSHPQSGIPVLVGDERVLKELFSKDCNIFNLNEWVEATDIKVIPYKTLDSYGVMTGFVPEEIYIDNKKSKEVIIAISPKQLEHGILINSGVF